MDILTLNKISKIGLKEFDSSYNILEECKNPQGIIVRSASMHEYEFSSETLAVARAGAGVNNIPVADCASKGVVVFNTPGANANAVKELVICGLMVSSRKVMASYDWCKGLKGEGENVGKLVEKGKSQFAGPEISGKILGLIGLGAIGRLVANSAIALGMKVIGFDAFLSDEAKALLNSQVQLVSSVEDIYENADDCIQLEIALLDKNGNTSSADDNVIYYQILGDGEILGIENGKPDDLTCYAEKYRSTYRGRAIVYLKKHAEKIRLFAFTKDGLTAEIEL